MAQPVPRDVQIDAGRLPPIAAREHGIHGRGQRVHFDVIEPEYNVQVARLGLARDETTADPERAAQAERAQLQRAPRAIGGSACGGAV
jgi:hypothetical protein